MFPSLDTKQSNAKNRVFLDYLLKYKFFGGVWAYKKSFFIKLRFFWGILQLCQCFRRKTRSNQKFKEKLKTDFWRKQRVVINILRFKMIKQTKPNNLTLPDLQNMCFWWRYKVLKKSKKIERAIFAGLSHSRGTEPNFAGSKWRRVIAAGLTFDSLMRLIYGI